MARTTPCWLTFCTLWVCTKVSNTESDTERSITKAIVCLLEQPTYGSGVIFELRKSGEEQQVHLYYANVTNNFDIYKLNLNESARFSALCKQSYCSVENFATSLATYLEKNAEQACQKAP